MENIKNQIHCKLTYLDQIRRFIFNGSDFSELRNYVSTMLQLQPETFVLKYIDNEGDRITMTSNEDMAIALSHLRDQVLRLVVDVPQAVPLQQPQFPPNYSNFPAPSNQQSFPPQQYQQFPQQSFPPQQYQQSPGYGQHYHHHHGGGRAGREARMLAKLESLKQALAQIPPEDQSNRKYHIQMKIKNLESKLLRMDAWQDRKVMKHQHKMEKKWDKRIDPQTLNQIEILKGQATSLKFSMDQIKQQKKAKKNELQICLQSGTGDREAIWKELLTLKESSHEIGRQISALKDQIRALRGF
jgi:hypothetical protein